MMRQDWIEIELGKIAKIFNGNSINARLKEEKYKVCKTGLNYIGTKDVAFDGNIEYENGVRIPFDEPKFKIAPKGCVLVCSEGGSAGRKTGYIEEDVCFGNKLFAITNEYSVFEGKYVYYYTRYRKFFQEFKNQLNGIIGGVSAKKFSNIKIDLSPLPEQRAIVSKIEELFSDLDKGVADLKKAQDQLKVYRQAVLKKAFEGDFTKSWRDSKKLNSDWTTYTFAEITESLKRGPFGGDLKKSFFVENGYAVYEQQHAINNDFTTIRYHIDQERYEKLKACNVGPGDYIVSCSGTMGKIARLPKGSPNGVINQALLRIRINESIISHEYFLEHFKSALFQRKILKDSRGSGMQNMAGIKEIKPIRIKVPTLPEQSQIIKEIESRLSVCDQVEESISESLNKAEALRQSILKKAFQGRLLSNEEIERCKAAPDYEPAAVLLQKIKNL